MKCKYCSGEEVIRYGSSQSGKQRYSCKNCHKSFQTDYQYHSCTVTDQQIIRLTKESCGIRSTGRILEISPNTVIRRILKIAANLKRPFPILKGKSYEVDELFTYVKHKDNRVVVAYSWQIENRTVIDIAVGRRNKGLLKRITDTLLLSEARKIKTDGLDLYAQLVPKPLHRVKEHGINGIESQKLNLRTHLKRLGRRTICFSKSLMLLLAVVRIYF